MLLYLQPCSHCQAQTGPQRPPIIFAGMALPRPRHQYQRLRRNGSIVGRTVRELCYSRQGRIRVSLAVSRSILVENVRRYDVTHYVIFVLKILG